LSAEPPPPERFSPLFIAKQVFEAFRKVRDSLYPPFFDYPTVSSAVFSDVTPMFAVDEVRLLFNPLLKAFPSSLFFFF